MAWKNKKSHKIKLIRGAFLILAIELISSVLLAYAEMPGLVQPSHLVFSTLLFGLLWIAILRFKANIITN